MLYGDWKEILNIAQIKAAELNAVQFNNDQPNVVQLSVAQLRATPEDNLISQIKEQLALNNRSAYEEWKAHGFNVNCMFLINVGYECTLLHIAACYGLGDVASVLLKKGARVDASDDYGKTPLYLAADNGHTEVVKILLQEKANVNAVSHDGTIPLHCAVGSGFIGIVHALLEKGAKVNTIGQDGLTPLHIAAGNGDLDIVRALLRKNANPLLRNSRGRTPKDLTWSTNLKQILTIAERIQLLKLVIIKGVIVGGLTTALGMMVAAWLVDRKYTDVDSAPIILAVTTIVAVALTVGAIVYKNLKPPTQMNEMHTPERRNSRQLEVSVV